MAQCHVGIAIGAVSDTTSPVSDTGDSVLARSSTRPNFLILLSDDQRADTIGAWGNRRIHTPNLDRLSREGFSFRRNYCFGANNGAVCIPSRAMLLSGRVWFDVANDLEGTDLLPERLGRAGYRTFATGKWHNGAASFARAFQVGHSVFLGGMADHTKVPVSDFANGSFSATRTASRFSSEEFAGAAIQFLEAQEKATSPFFCYVSFTAPHDPRNAPQAYRDRYYQRLPPVPKNFLPQHPFDQGWTLGLRDENLAAYPREPRIIQCQLAEYYALITHMDEQIGRILATLQRTGLSSNTIVLFAADSGLALGSHGLLGKQSVYEHSMRAPMIIRGPGIPQGGSTTNFTYLHDLFPTICRLAGVPESGKEAGIDLSPLWSGTSRALRPTVFLPFTDSMRSIRDQRWKLICYPQINRRQLFDLQRDPEETRDLSGDPRQRQNIERLTLLLMDAQRHYGDQQPLAVDHPKSDHLDPTGYRRSPDSFQPRWIVEKYFDSQPSQ